MAKKKGMLIVGIILIVVFGYMAFVSPNKESGIVSTQFSVVGPWESSTTCTQAATTYLEGAKEVGDCFVYTLNNQKAVAYVNKMDEKASNCAISPSCPNGVKPHCSISSCSSCWADIFTCTEAWDNGVPIKVCKYDSDCESGICVNALCKDTQARDCSKTGETRCYSASKFQSCLSNGKWSGMQTCATGKTCYVDKCLTQQQIDDLNDAGDADNGKGTTLDFGDLIDNQTLMYIGLILGIVLVLMALM